MAFASLSGNSVELPCVGKGQGARGKGVSLHVPFFELPSCATEFYYTPWSWNRRPPAPQLRPLNQYQQCSQLLVLVLVLVLPLLLLVLLPMLQRCQMVNAYWKIVNRNVEIAMSGLDTPEQLGGRQRLHGGRSRQERFCCICWLRKEMFRAVGTTNRRLQSYLD